MNNPEYVKINDKKYKINTDFRIAIECNQIAKETTIGEHEKALAVIYKLFGDEGLNNPQDYEKLLELGQKYLNLGEELESNDEEPDMDFEQDKHYIRSSFIQDYHYNPYDLSYLHWWDFYHDLNGLTNSEFGNCCVLSRIRNLRTYDVSQIKDLKEQERIIKAQERVSLKKNKQEIVLTEEQEESIRRFNEMIGMR